MDADLIARWARGEACQRALVDAATVLRGRCELVAIKGVYIADLEELPRRISVDADAVVIGARLWELRSTLEHAGWRVAALSAWGTLVVVDPKTGVSVDLHRAPLPPGFGALNAAALRRRAHRGRDRLSGLLVPDPLDAAIIAIAHFVKDGFGTTHGHGRLDSDLDVLHRRFEITPQQLLPRLMEHRLRRAALLAFEALRRRDERWRRWLDECSMGAKEQGYAVSIVSWVLKRPAFAGYVVPLVVRTFADDPLRVPSSIAAHTWTVAHDWGRHASLRVRAAVRRGLADGW